MWINLLCVFFGGSIGTACRAGLQYLLPAAWYPVGIINLLGSAFLGVLAGFFSTRTHIPSMNRWFIFLGTGFCGGFTTMSSFVLALLHAHCTALCIYGALFLISFLCTIFLYRKTYALTQNQKHKTR